MTTRLASECLISLLALLVAACSDDGAKTTAGTDDPGMGGSEMDPAATGGMAAAAEGGATQGLLGGRSSELAAGGSASGGAPGSSGNTTGGSEHSGGSASGGAIDSGGAASSGGIANGGFENIGGAGTSGASSSSGTTSAGGSEHSGGSASGGAIDSGGATNSGGTAGGGTENTGGAATGGTANELGWTLVWSDEFDGPSIDPNKWEHEVNCWGGGNGEDQCYVADEKNSFITDGELHIVALADHPSGAVAGPDNDPAIVTLGHSSARLRTLTHGDWKYGRIEALAKLPHGQGLWPAIWMLPSDSVYGGWAASGEIDIMEAINLGPGANQVHGTLHYGGAWPNNTNSGTSFEPATNAWESYHLYAVEWEEGTIRWFVDDTHYATQNQWYSDAGTFPAPFDERFHLLLNVAVGGAWPGPPDASTTFPQEMVVDYVRVYSCDLDPATGHGCGTTDPSIVPL